jgi:hypothetical protein
MALAARLLLTALDMDTGDSVRNPLPWARSRDTRPHQPPRVGRAAATIAMGEFAQRICDWYLFPLQWQTWPSACS